MVQFSMTLDPVILSSLRSRLEYSPDFRDFTYENYIPVFLYNYLQTGNAENMSVLENSPFLGVGKTIHSGFVMKNTVFPVVFEDRNKTSSVNGHIHGEVYLVTPEVLLNIDYVLKNTKLTERKKIQIICMDQKIKTKKDTFNATLPCWTYFGKVSYWEHQQIGLMASICGLKDVKGKKDRYYKCWRKTAERPGTSYYDEVMNRHM